MKLANVTSWLTKDKTNLVSTLNRTRIPILQCLLSVPLSHTEDLCCQSDPVTSQLLPTIAQLSSKTAVMTITSSTGSISYFTAQTCCTSILLEK